MTFLIFTSCALLIFGPIFVVANASVLSQVKYGHYFLFGFLSNLGWQIAKLFILGSFYPFFDMEIYDPVQEIIKIVGMISEIIIVYFTLRYLLKEKNKANISKHKIIVLGFTLGWFTVGSLLTQFLPLFNTLGVEFNWVYTFNALDNNIKLLEQFALNTCIYLYIVNNNKYLIESPTTSKTTKNQEQNQLPKQYQDSKLLLNLLLIGYLVFEAFASFFFHRAPYHSFLFIKAFYSLFFFKVTRI
ncbi:hypothetical protein DICPUDRAFT_75673 [Dictyostelium purpureum]|uniref:BOS complex subunit TMEM147 n=1 Tax=Dictyostelium purpureum TaxID=5786 RepID=F0ZBC3_DICPU|nr:uncharacterized protein DICPUDRAFT_75673 [Dictyostelium purpureum]EGC38721.1 hypothetical protein DICPUDRAFT_75673 [Dictyostelium purpureum]|eukprot:XP_003284712.1 hypothetical protein DICPUDRAFT_75673 [Dictyostelium purpureum]